MRLLRQELVKLKSMTEQIEDALRKEEHSLGPVQPLPPPFRFRTRIATYHPIKSRDLALYQNYHMSSYQVKGLSPRQRPKDPPHFPACFCWLGAPVWVVNSLRA